MIENKKYQYLKKYVNFNSFKEGGGPYNWFEPITRDEINKAERQLGFSFPSQLKEFWLEIGFGSLPNTISNENSVKEKHFLNNHFIHPNNIADIFILKDESEYILPYIVEEFESYGENAILFFEIGDMSSFLIMRPTSEYTNAVYDQCGVMIEKDFERFIWKLYHESADYYLRAEDYFKRGNHLAVVK